MSKFSSPCDRCEIRDECTASCSMWKEWWVLKWRGIQGMYKSEYTSPNNLKEKNKETKGIFEL